MSLSRLCSSFTSETGIQNGEFRFFLYPTSSLSLTSVSSFFCDFFKERMIKFLFPSKIWCVSQVNDLTTVGVLADQILVCVWMYKLSIFFLFVSFRRKWDAVICAPRRRRNSSSNLMSSRKSSHSWEWLKSPAGLLLSCPRCKIHFPPLICYSIKSSFVEDFKFA